MSGNSFKSVKASLLKCSKIPERAKEILNLASNSLNDLDENDYKELLILIKEGVNTLLNIDDTSEDKELILYHQYVIQLVLNTIVNAEDVMCVYGNECLFRIIVMYQSLYPKNIPHKLKLLIVTICSKFWRLFEASQIPNRLEFSTSMKDSFTFTLTFLFNTIKKTTKKPDMKILSSFLWDFCKVVRNLPSNQNILHLIVSNLENIMNNILFLETETGKLIVAEIFTTSQQLFLKFHKMIKKNLVKSNKSCAESYGEIYFIAWINSNNSMKEVIEQQGMFDLISNTLLLKRTGVTYRNALYFLQSMQKHRKHLIFSKVITKLYAPVIWRQLLSECNIIRCNAVELLARVYPLEKRGEGREVSSRFLIKQQDALLDLLEDPCPQVRIAAIKGICGCMRYFWDSFEDDLLKKCFNLFSRLIDENVFEVRRNLFYGFCQLLDESKSHLYFKTPVLMAKIKNTLNDENEKVRRAFIHFLLKIKEVDRKSNEDKKINFAKIVDLRGAAGALAREDKPNGILLTDLIFDNFIGDQVPDRHSTLIRFNMFYKINPTAFRKLILYSQKVLDFDGACELILSLLKTAYNGVKKKEQILIEKENLEENVPAKKRKSNDNSVNMRDANSSSNSSKNNSEVPDPNEHSNICCILDCVYCLMVVHRKTLIDENNHQKMKDIQSSCTSCLVKLLKFYKEGDAYFCAMNLASLISISKLTPHVSVSSAAISTLKQLPNNIEEKEIDMRKVNCLVYTLCMWNRGFEIIQFVNVSLDEAFKTLNLNETQYPESTTIKTKKVRFQTNIEECKPMSGILLINSMLTNPQTQKTLLDSEVNKKNIYDLISYLQRIKPAIENRISSDNVLSNLLSDEVLIELFRLNMRLKIFYYCNEELGDDEIIKYHTSILDWIINNLLIPDLLQKTENTITFVVNVLQIVNYMILNICLLSMVNSTFLDHFLSFCATVLNNVLAPQVLISMITTLVIVSKHFNYLKLIDSLGNDISTLTSCVCSIVLVLNESKFDKERFTNVIGEPNTFRREVTLLLMQIYKLSSVEFERVFKILFDIIIYTIANQIREIDEVDMNQKLTEIPFVSFQLVMVILNNAQLRKHFSSNAVKMFSSDMYKNDSALLLSAISFIYTLSFQENQIKAIDFEPIVKLLYTILMEHDKTTSPLGGTIVNVENNTNADQESVSALETSDFSDGIKDYKTKGRKILIATASQLRITLSE